MSLNIIYKIGIAVSTLIIWGMIISAKFTEYDRNYGLVIYSMLFSLIVTFLIIIVAISNKDLVYKSKVITAMFIITSSPVSIFLFLLYYPELFGQYFNHL